MYTLDQGQLGKRFGFKPIFAIYKFSQISHWQELQGVILCDSRVVVSWLFWGRFKFTLLGPEGFHE